jgi:hypothetical protein
LLKKLSEIFLQEGLDRLLGVLPVGQTQYLAVVIPQLDASRRLRCAIAHRQMTASLNAGNA